MDNYYTYLLIDPRDNKPFYVGKGIKNRMTKHERQVRLGKIPNNNQFLFNKINKILSLGLVLKYKQPVQCVTEDIAFKWETRFIKCLRAKGYDLCNISDGGQATRGNQGKRYTQEERLELSKKRKGMMALPWFIDRYGKENGIELYNKRSKLISSINKGRKMPPITEETRNKLIFSHLGKKQSPETVLKRSISMIGKGLGRPVSEETRKRLSMARKGLPSVMLGKRHSLESRVKMKNSHIKHYTFLSPSNDVVSISCLKDFCKENHINYGNMSSVATGHRKSCQGWRII